MPRGQSWDQVPEESVGKVKEFPDVNFSASSTVKPRLTNMKVKCRLVKNTSGGALTPGTTVLYETGYWGTQVDSAGGAGRVHGIVDEYLPSAGVPANEYFWIVIHGPCKARMEGSASVAEKDPVKAVASGRVDEDGDGLSIDSIGEMMEAGSTTQDTLNRIFFNPPLVGG